MEDFKDLRIVDNFYQTSAFFPMPTILVGTVSPEGKTNLGAYSLCFPYYVAGKDYYAMLLECRNSSNTAQNLLRSKKCSLNFITDERKYFKEAVRLGFPGETTQEKMKNCLFTLKNSALGKDRPQIIAEAFQVFECTWDDSLEKAFKDKPCYDEQHEGKGYHYHHPLSEADSHIHSVGVVEKFECYGVWRSTDRSAHASYIGAYRNGEREAYFPFSVGRERTEHGGEECEHHRRGGRVAYEHREECRDEDKAQKHILRFGAEWRKHHSGEFHVKAAFCSGDCYDEASDK